MITRKQYMSGEFSHEAYYAQFATDDMAETLLRTFGLARLILDHGTETGDPGRIDLESWDELPVPRGLYDALGRHGDVNARTLCNVVCAYKAAARLIVGRCYIACKHDRCNAGSTCCKRAWHHLGSVCTHCGMED